MRRATAVVSLLVAACIHKRPPHLEPEPGSASGSGSGSAAGSGGAGSGHATAPGELGGTWKIAKHVSAAHAALDDHDASALDGRIVEITSLGYTSPWQGTCESATRARTSVALADVVARTGLGANGRAALEAFGFTDPLVEFDLACDDALKAPPLALWLTRDQMFTCFQGTCYLLRRTDDNP